MSLGPQYRMYVNLACMYSKDQFTLRNVMAKAREFELNEPADEANTSQMALQAAETKFGCTNCGHPWHKASECFAKGGGLSHLNSQQRYEWLLQQRKRREAKREEHANMEVLKKKIRSAKEKLRNEGLSIDLGL